MEATDQDAPNTSELGLIYGMVFMSTVKRAWTAVRRNIKQDNPKDVLINAEDDYFSDVEEEDNSMTEEDSHPAIDLVESPLHPNYKKVCSLMEAADCVIGGCNFSGTQFLGLRANNQLNNLGTTQKLH